MESKKQIISSEASNFLDLLEQLIEALRVEGTSKEPLILDARKLFMLKDDEAYKFIWENINFSLAFEEEENPNLAKAMEFRYWSILEASIANDVIKAWEATLTKDYSNRRARLKAMGRMLKKINKSIKFNVPTVVINKILSKAHKTTL